MADPGDAPATLGELALEVRSKNAGPFWMTLEAFMPDDQAYRIADALITAELISELYHVPPASLQIFRIPDLRVVKVSFPRPIVQGSLRDRDMHAGQHHVPLANVNVSAAQRKHHPRDLMTATSVNATESLARWDTPALSNALDALRLRPRGAGYSDGSIQRITGTAAPMVGRAVTARMAAREPGEDGISVSHLHKAIAQTDGPVVVVLEDRDDPAGAGAFLGEVNGSLLAALPVKGVITNGRVRDVAELRAFPYPVYAAGLCVARAYMRLTDVGTDVTVAGLTVRPGDLLHGDEHGVLHLPPGALPDIIEQAELIRENEQKIVEWSRSADFSVDKLLQLRRGELAEAACGCRKPAPPGHMLCVRPSARSTMPGGQVGLVG